MAIRLKADRIPSPVDERFLGSHKHAIIFIDREVHASGGIEND